MELRAGGMADFVQDNWVWDGRSCSDDVQLSADQKEAYFFVDPVIQSTNTVGVRGSLGFAEGEHYWEVILLEPPCGNSVMIGVGTNRADLRDEHSTNLVGKDSESWGLTYKGQLYHCGIAQKYCEPFFAKNTVIGVHLDLNQGHMTFYKNGECLGLAFTGLKASRKHRLFPMVSSTATEMELGVGRRLRQLAQPVRLETECLLLIKQKLDHQRDIQKLPLPGVLRKCLEGD